MDAPAHHFIECFPLRFAVQHGALAIHHIPIVTHSRSRLCLHGRKAMDLPCRLVYQRPHHIERYAVPAQYIRSQSITMVHKIASKYRCQMETAASPVLISSTLSETERANCSVCASTSGVDASHKDRNLLEIHRTIFRECLHGIQHAITMGVTTEKHPSAYSPAVCRHKASPVRGAIRDTKPSNTPSFTEKIYTSAPGTTASRSSVARHPKRPAKTSAEAIVRLNTCNVSWPARCRASPTA